MSGFSLSSIPVGERVFTSGQIARICQVAARTVSKWFDAGRIKGYKIPGSQDRRVPYSELMQFLQQSGMPIPAYLKEQSYTVCLGDPFRGGEKKFPCKILSGLFDLGAAVADPNPPLAFVITDQFGMVDAVRVATAIRQRPILGGTAYIVGAFSEDADVTGLSSLKAQYENGSGKTGGQSRYVFNVVEQFPVNWDSILACDACPLSKAVDPESLTEDPSKK